MYGKIFASMYDGSIYGKWKAIVTFQQMIALADKDGVVDMTSQALSARTSIPLEIINEGIEILESPDSVSRTPDEDGRRIILLDDNRPWGWCITNYQKYREIRTAEERREYHRQYYHNNRKGKVSTVSTKTQQTQPIVEVKAEVDIKNQNTTSSPKGDNPVPFQKIVDLYHEKLPELPRCEILNTKRKGYIRQRWQDKEHGLPNLESWGNFFNHVRMSKFLMGKTQSRDGRPPFRANLEWLTNLNNYTKIYEDKYHGKV